MKHIKRKFLAVFQNGLLQVEQKKEFFDYVKSLGKNGEKFVIILDKIRKNRSNKQNAYYWGVVLAILGEELGYTVDEMNEAIKLQFLLDRSKRIPTTRSMKDLSTAEFEEKLSKIRMWASLELQINIPEPNEIDF